MIDVFLSYAREDSAFAERLVAAFSRAGLEVFWDDRLGVEKFKDEIRARIEQSACVIVCCSEHSVSSSYVQWEANIAPKRTFGCRVDAVSTSRMPVEVKDRDIADLQGWSGEWDHRGLTKLISRAWMQRSGLLELSAVTPAADSAGGRTIHVHGAHIETNSGTISIDNRK